MLKKIWNAISDRWKEITITQELDHFPATNIETTQELVQVLIYVGILQDDIVYFEDDIEEFKLNSIINKGK